MMWNEVINGLAGKICNSKGVSVFVKNESKFENWLQVELCGLLKEKGEDVQPEKTIPETQKGVDIYCNSENEKYACELKVVLMKQKKENGRTNSVSHTLSNILNKDIVNLQNSRKKLNLAHLYLIFAVVCAKEFGKFKEEGINWQTQNQQDKVADIRKLLKDKKFMDFHNPEPLNIEENNNGINFKLFFGEVA